MQGKVNKMKININNLKTTLGALPEEEFLPKMETVCNEGVNPVFPRNCAMHSERWQRWHWETVVALTDPSQPLFCSRGYAGTY
jgi:hypothetical protein